MFGAPDLGVEHGRQLNSRVVPMRGAAKPDFRWDLPPPRSDPKPPHTRDDRHLAMAYEIAGAVMDIVGLLFWAALVLAFMTGALRIDLFR
jgi:hypothetical protein